MTKSSLFVVVVKFNSEPPRGVRNLIIVDNDKINRGFAAGVNIGIKQALKKGAKAVLLLNPDVEISQAQIEALLATPGDIVSPVLTFSRHGQKVLDYGGKVNFLFGRTTHWENTQGPIEYVSGACMLVRREVFEKIGLFDERYFLYFEDVDFCLRAKQASFSVQVATDVVVKHDLKEHRVSLNFLKIKSNLTSNLIFISRWLPWYFRPLGYLYVFLLALKVVFQKVTAEPILEPILRLIRFEKVLKHIKMNSIVVDVGCGHTPHLLNRLERYIKSGIGLDQLTINARLGKIELISQILSDKISLKDDFADHVTLVAVLEHLANPQALVNESFRILKKGGSLIITTPTPLNKPLLEFLSFRLGVVSRREIAEHKEYYWRGDLIATLKKAGFKKIRHEYFELFLNNFVIAYKT